MSHAASAALALAASYWLAFLELMRFFGTDPQGLIDESSDLLFFFLG